MAGKRIIILFSVLGVVAAIALASWVAGSHIESPADVAARTAPPKPSPILVPVEKRVLSSNIVTRGTARFGLPQPVSVVPSALKSGPGLIATLPLRNTQFKEGDVMLTASGRPVFVLQGKVPAYRDLIPGLAGDDIRQLEQALVRLGFNPGPVDGRYDQKTSAAVSKWYRTRGWEPFAPTAQQLARFRSLKKDWQQANKKKLATANTVTSANLTVETTRATANYNKRSAAAALAKAKSERALIALDPRQPKTVRAAAEAKLELVKAAKLKAKLDGELAIRAAQDARKLAKLDAGLAKAEANRLAADLQVAKSKLGVQVPADEIVFLPALPVRVEKVSALVGGAAAGTVMKVTDNKLAIDASLPLDAAPLVKPGMRVSIDEHALGVKATGVVAMVASTPGTRGVDGYHIYFEVKVDETKTRLEGFSLRLTIPIESTKGKVIAVPASALSLSVDGTSRVQVEHDGVLEYIVVEPGMAADGYVEVLPVDGKLLAGQLVVVGFENPDNGFKQ